MSPVVGDELPQQPDVTTGDARQVRVPSDPRAAALPHVSASRIVGERGQMRDEVSYPWADDVGSPCLLYTSRAHET